MNPVIPWNADEAGSRDIRKIDRVLIAQRIGLDDMKQIWSPWRMKYIMRHERTPGCIFCNAIKNHEDEKDLVLWRGPKTFVILNRYPYTSGHLMVVPNVHQPSLSSLDDDTRCELMAVLSRSERIIRQVYHPEGFNVGANIGAAAGAGVAGHIHFHVVPRWAGDTNFMTTLADARVLPENLNDTYSRLLDVWNSLPE